MDPLREQAGSGGRLFIWDAILCGICVLGNSDRREFSVDGAILFAFAISDRSKRQLLLAPDRLESSRSTLAAEGFADFRFGNQMALA
jgi:hypothetical protein